MLLQEPVQTLVRLAIKKCRATTKGTYNVSSNLSKPFSSNITEIQDTENQIDILLAEY